MTTPSGQIAMSDVNVEIGLAWNANIWLDHGGVRALAGAGGGGTRMEMNWLRGKSSYTPMSAWGNEDLVTDPWGGTGTSRTYTAHPSVGVSGGKPGYSYLWEWQQNGGGMTLLDTTYQTCRVNYASKYSSYAYGVLRCRITDSTGAVVWVYDITVEFSIGEVM